MGKFTISMAIFKFANCKRLPGRVHQFLSWLFRVTTRVSELATSRHLEGSLKSWKLSFAVVEGFPMHFVIPDGLFSMDWLKGKSQPENSGNHRFSHEICGFPAIFPVKTNPLMFGFPGKLTDQPMFQSEI